MLTLSNVTFSYKSTPVLKDFDFALHGNTRLCLFGPSGCGKTTLLRLIAGLEKPQKGSVTANGKCSFVFQEDRLVPTLTVAENIALVGGNPEILDRFGLADCKDELPAALSGGMRRRVAIARALAYGGDLLLLDEPFNGLDAENKRLAAQIILEYFKDKPLLLVSHDPEDAALLGAELFYMQKASD